MSANFATATTATVKMNVGLNANGNIATGQDAVAGNKTFSIPGIKQAATLTEANTVFTNIVGNIAGGSFDSLSAVKTWSVGVVEE